MAIESLFGWVLSGQVKETGICSEETAVLSAVENDNKTVTQETQKNNQAESVELLSTESSSLEAQTEESVQITAKLYGERSSFTRETKKKLPERHRVVIYMGIVLISLLLLWWGGFYKSLVKPLVEMETLIPYVTTEALENHLYREKLPNEYRKKMSGECIQQLSNRTSRNTYSIQRIKDDNFLQPKDPPIDIEEDLHPAALSAREDVRTRTGRLTRNSRHLQDSVD